MRKKLCYVSFPAVAAILQAVRQSSQGIEYWNTCNKFVS